MTEDIVIYCEDCMTTPVTGNRTFCPQCKERRKSEHHPNPNKQQPLPKVGIQKCKDCDKPARSVQAHRCNDCQPIHKRNMSREHARKRLGRVNPNRPCKWCSEEIDYSTEGINVRQEYHTECLKKRDAFKRLSYRHKRSMRTRLKADDYVRIAIKELESVLESENLQTRVRRMHTLGKFLMEFNTAMVDEQAHKKEDEKDV